MATTVHSPKSVGLSLQWISLDQNTLNESSFRLALGDILVLTLPGTDHTINIPPGTIIYIPLGSLDWAADVTADQLAGAALENCALELMDSIHANQVFRTESDVPF